MSSDGDCGGGSRDGIVGSLVQRRPGGGAAVDSRTRDCRELSTVASPDLRRESGGGQEPANAGEPLSCHSTDSEAAASTQRMLSACESEGTCNKESLDISLL